MSTAKHPAFRLEPMAYNPAVTVFTFGGQALDGTFKAVEDVGLVLKSHRESFVIHIAAGFAGDGVIHKGYGDKGSQGIAACIPSGPLAKSHRLLLCPRMCRLRHD